MNYKSILLAGLLMVSALGCSDRLDEINQDPNRLEASEANPGPLFAKSVTSALHKDNFSQLLGYLADIGPYAHYFTALYPTAFSADPYFNANQWSDFGFWNIYWNCNSVLTDVLLLTSPGSEYENANSNAMARIWKVYIIHRLTDIYGDLPYFEGGQSKQGIINPKYDTQAEIYGDLFGQLDQALDDLSVEVPGQLKTQDIIYNGDIEKWKMFGNSLRLRLALRLHYIDPNLAIQEGEKALEGGIISSNVGNALEISGDGHGKFWQPLHQISRNLFAFSPSFKVSESFVELLKANHSFNDGGSTSGEDPRLDVLVADNINGEKMGIPNGHTAEYLTQHPEFADLGSWVKHHDDLYEPVMIMSYAESKFLEAEAALRGYTGVSGTTQDLYQQGIEASMEYLDVNSGSFAIDEALLFSGLSKDEDKLERIIYQKWIALFPDTHEAWNEQRRTGYPVIKKRKGAIFEKGITDGTIPNRIPYPPGEYNTNYTNVVEARDRQGGDDLLKKVWWDKKTLQDSWE